MLSSFSGYTGHDGHACSGTVKSGFPIVVWDMPDDLDATEPSSTRQTTATKDMPAVADGVAIFWQSSDRDEFPLTTSTTTSPQPSHTGNPDDDGGLRTPAKVGIGVGVGIGVPLLLIFAWIFYRRRRHDSSTKAAATSAYTEDNMGAYAAAEADSHPMSELESPLKWHEMPSQQHTQPYKPVELHEDSIQRRLGD